MVSVFLTWDIKKKMPWFYTNLIILFWVGPGFWYGLSIPNLETLKCLQPRTFWGPTWCQNCKVPYLLQVSQSMSTLWILISYLQTTPMRYTWAMDFLFRLETCSQAVSLGGFTIWAELNVGEGLVSKIWNTSGLKTRAPQSLSLNKCLNGRNSVDIGW